MPFAKESYWLDVNPEHVRVQDQEKDYFTIKPSGLAKTAILIAFNLCTNVNMIVLQVYNSKYLTIDKFTVVNIKNFTSLQGFPEFASEKRKKANCLEKNEMT